MQVTILQNLKYESSKKFHGTFVITRSLYNDRTVIQFKSVGVPLFIKKKLYQVELNEDQRTVELKNDK